MKIINLSNKHIVGDRIKVADSLFSRVMGLLDRDCLNSGEGLLLKNANSIHSLGMRFNFDAVYLDKNYKVVSTIENIKPWRIMPIVFSARHVLELPAGMVDKAGILVDDYLEFQ